MNVENKIELVEGSENTNVPVDNGTVNQIPQVEQEARNQGWVPKEEWQGDPEKWRPAKEFIDRGELLKKIESSQRELKQTNQALKQLAQHHRQVREVEYQRAINDLKKQRKAALIEQDMERVAELDDEIDFTKEQASIIPEIHIPEVKEAPAGLVIWEENNKWYKSDRAMTAFTIDLAADLRKQGYQLEDALKIIDKEIRKEFPHKFRNRNTPSAASVEGTGRARSGESSDSFQLSDDQRRVMRKFIQMGAVKDEKEYVEQLKAVM